jgi:hypothetical protein
MNFRVRRPVSNPAPGVLFTVCREQESSCRARTYGTFPRLSSAITLIIGDRHA